MATYFDIDFHYGGRFIEDGDEVRYVDGQVEECNGIDKDRFGFFNLEGIANKKGYYTWEKFQYCIPGMSLKAGLRDLKADKDVMDMIKGLIDDELVAVYIVGNEIEVVVGDNEDENNLPDVAVDNENSVVASQAVNNVIRDRVAQGYDSEEEGSEEDPDYEPVGESDTDDGLLDSDMDTDDEEYIEARKNFRTQKNKKTVLQEPQLENFIIRPVDPGASTEHDTNDSINNEFVSHYNDSNAEVHTIYSSDEDEFDEVSSHRRRRFSTYDPNSDHKMDSVFKLGMKFDNVAQCKKAVQKYALINLWEIRIIRSSKTQLEARCQTICNWRLYGSETPNDPVFKIKVYRGVHNCSRELNNRQATSTWIAKFYLNKLRRNPNWPVNEMVVDLKERTALTVSIWKCYRAKGKALEMLRGSNEEHYAMLRSYKAELMRVDREGRFEFKMDDTQVDCVFQRFYVGFSSLVQGFKKGGRPVVGFDGTFLKTSLGGHF